VEISGLGDPLKDAESERGWITNDPIRWIARAVDFLWGCEALARLMGRWRGGVSIVLLSCGHERERLVAEWSHFSVVSDNRIRRRVPVVFTIQFKESRR